MQLPIMAATYVAFVMLLVLVGRVNAGHGKAETAARSAARVIALARDPAAAVAAAEDTAAVIADTGSATCRSMDLSHTIGDTDVTVTVTCQVDLGELTLAGVPAQWSATATASEPLDRWREGSSELALTGGPSGTEPTTGATS